MEFTPKTITLKNGAAALLRSPLPDDAAAMVDFMDTVAAETENLIMSPEDGSMSIEQESEYLASSLTSETEAMIVCEIDGHIAGNCQISFNRRARTRHRAGVAIALREKYWGLGIGAAMFRELIALARDRGVYQIELEYIEGNDRGRALYEKMGFQAYGEHPDAIRLPDGSMRKFITMRKVL